MKKSRLALYPPNWREIAQACKEAAGWKCERCGAAHKTWKVGHKTAYKVSLAAAHIDHDPQNPHPRLQALCNDCHLKHDGLEHARVRARKRTNAMKEAGQLELFAEGEGLP